MSYNNFKRKLYSNFKNNTCPICSSKLTKLLHCPNKEHLFLFEISDSSKIIAIKFSIINKISAPYIYINFKFKETSIFLPHNKKFYLNYLISINFKDFSNISNIIDKLQILQ